MPSEITMPQLSDTMTEGTVVKWHMKEGEPVKSGQEIADVETDKATMPMEAFESGTLAHIAITEGQKAQVGALLAVIATAGEDPADVKKQYAGATAPKAAKPTPAAATPTVQSHGGTPHDIEQGSAEMAQQDAKASQEVTATGAHGPAPAMASAQVPPPSHGRNGKPERVRISPLAARIAAEQGVDLARVQGSGPAGRIVQRDIMAFLSDTQIAPPTPPRAPAAPAPKAPAAAEPKAAPAPLPAPVATGEKRVLQMNKMRTAIATALQRSKQQVPHFYETIDIDLEELTQLRERLNQKLEKEKIRLSIADFIAKAVAAALIKHPALNARFNAEKGEITQYGDVNLGIAVAIPDGLIVPVLRSANQMGLRDIRVRSADLIERARAQRLRREEQSEGTFTISSLGSFGIRQFSAIINPPEVGILAVGSAEKRPVVKGEQIIARTMLSVTLSCDHRVVDGATAAEFLSTLKSLLEEPGLLLV